jgi:hypothetical protein
MSFHHHLRQVYLVLTVFALASCKPAITSFRVSPLVITGDQKVKIDLDVDGKPSMEFNEHLSVDSVQLLEFTLIATKNGKEARRTVQVQKLKPSASIVIAFETTGLEGDSVTAAGENNNSQWADFRIVSVSSSMSRDIMVAHEGRTATLKSDGSPSMDLSGTTAGGQWSLRTRLTPSEKTDSTRIPQELSIKAIIKPANP